MKFNKKFLAKVAIFSAILGLNGMCFDNMVNCLESGKKKDVICAKCGRTAYFRPIRVKKNFFCLECITYARREVPIFNSPCTCTEYVLEPDFVEEYSLEKEDTESINQNIANQGFRVVRFEDQPLDVQERNRASYDQRRIKKENNSKKVKVENKNPADKRTCSVCSKEKSAEFLCQGKYSTKNICNDCFHRINDITCPFCNLSGRTNVIKNLGPNKEAFCRMCYSENETIKLPCCKERLCYDCSQGLNDICPFCHKNWETNKKAFCWMCFEKATIELHCCNGRLCDDCFQNGVICPFCYCYGKTNVIKNLETNKEAFCCICLKKATIELPCCKGRFLCKDCIFKLNKNRYLIFQIDENNEIFKIKHKK